MTTIGITLGDVNGIGPEVAIKAALRLARQREVRLVLVGSPAIIQAHLRRYRLTLPARVRIWDPAGLTLDWRPGQQDPACAVAAARWIEATVLACLGGELDAMVTAPISKENFHAAGICVPGHTEMIAGLTRTRRFAMMLLGGPLRVVLATRHVPLREVAQTLSRRQVLDTIRITGEALPWLGFPQGHIGVCGLNPHAGDGGALGNEEARIITPAITAARKAGLNVTGPVPGDVIFHQAVNGRFEAVVAMYHDQGLGPLKMLAFDSGVNITLGIPMVRTSPDHGTAFDLAGKNQAQPGSMINAVEWAIRLARRPNPWGMTVRADPRLKHKRRAQAG